MGNTTKSATVVLMCLFVLLASEVGYALDPPPITKRNLIAALNNCKARRSCRHCQQCKLGVADFIKLIKQQKVNFQLDRIDEQEIREAANFFSKKDVDQLIYELRVSYHPVKLPVDYKNLVDSCGDSALDAKVRLVHTSVNNTLHLDTNYKFVKAPFNTSVMPDADKKYTDGTLLIGIAFIETLYTEDPSNTLLTNDALLYLVIAHELAHLKQRKNGMSIGNFKSKQIELHADYLSGWSVARFLRTTNNTSSEYKDSFLKVINFAFRFGDKPTAQRNGTPKERLDAVSAGFDLQNENNPERVYQKGLEYVNRF